MPASLFSMCKHTKERPCEQSGRTASTHSEEISPEPNQVGPLSLDFQPLEWQEIHFCCLGHPIYGILLCQAELTKTVIIFLKPDVTMCSCTHCSWEPLSYSLWTEQKLYQGSCSQKLLSTWSLPATGLGAKDPEMSPQTRVPASY